jgi:hypothetical protein
MQAYKKEVNRMKRKNLIMISVLAFVCAFALAEFKSIAAKIKVEEWLLIEKYGVVSCSYDRLVDSDRSLPFDKNGGNSCPHQSGASCLLSMSESKRNKIHKC